MPNLEFKQFFAGADEAKLSCHFHHAQGSHVTLHYLHGNGFAVRSYQALLERLKGGENIFLQDAPGHGLSPAGDRFIGWNACASRFYTNLISHKKELALGSLIGMGHSFGGCMTLLMSAQDTNLFKFNILLDPALYPPHMIWLLKGVHLSGLRRKLPLIRQTEMRRTSWTSTENAIESLTDRGTFKGWEKSCLEDYVRYSTHKGDDGSVHLNCPTWLEAAVFGSAPKGLWRMVKTITTPTYILWGSETFDMFKEAYRLARRLNPNIYLVEVRGGHCFMQQYPEQTARLVRAIMDHGAKGITDVDHADFVISCDDLPRP